MNITGLFVSFLICHQLLLENYILHQEWQAFMDLFFFY